MWDRERDPDALRHGALGLLLDGVAELSDLGSEEAYELLQEVSRVAAGSDAAFTGERRDAVMVEVVGVLLAAQMRASGKRRLEQRRVQLRSAVAEVVEAAVRDRDVDLVLSAAVRVLRRVMSCQGASIRAFEVAGAPRRSPYAASYPPEVDDFLTDEMIDIAGLAASICWERQTAYHLLVDEPDAEPLVSPESRDFALAFLARVGASELLLAPMGADGHCQGWIALTRSDVQEPFGPDDVEAVLAIGRELGNAVRHARAFASQQELIGQLRELSNHKSWFTTTLAHQLRTPLTSIRLHVDELASHQDGLEADASDSSAEGLAAIARSVRTIEGSIDSLLDLARLEERAHEPAETTRVDLSDVLTRVVEECRHNAEAVGVTLDVAGVETGAEVTGEVHELSMVVDNILGNAVKYSRPGGTVRLTLTTDGPEVVLACHDEGIGMAPRDLALIFTPFHRALDARERHIPGSGLGMAIVEAVVTRCGGRIDAQSAPGRGTRIEVRLPLARADA